jgi:predicted transcriptional regulator
MMELRKEKNISQGDLAKLLKSSFSVIEDMNVKR